MQKPEVDGSKMHKKRKRYVSNLTIPVIASFFTLAQTD